MVKREAIQENAVIQVSKVMPGDGQAGPRFSGKLEIGEELIIRGKPFSTGGMNLVKVKRKTTGEVIDLLYAFVTVYCKPAEADPGGG